MAITTLDGALAGMRPPAAMLKTGPTMAAAGARRMFTPWYASGFPGASTATSVGVNGEAVTPALGSVAGRYARTNPSTGNAYVGRFSVSASTVGVIYLLDRVWQNSGLSATSTALQSITPAAIPSRDMNGAALGRGLFPAIEWSAGGGAGTPTVTLTYTNQDGTTGRTGTLTGVTSPGVGTVEMFDLQAGDTGVRAITGYQASATRTSGTFHLVLFRIIAQVEVGLANTATSYDGLSLGFPRVYDDSVLQMGYQSTGTAATNFATTYVETHG
jgi:hypothetical protein